MANISSWQEEGVHVGGKVFSDREAKEIVSEMKKRVSDLDVINELEDLLGFDIERLPVRKESKWLYGALDFPGKSHKPSEDIPTDEVPIQMFC